ncbi:TIGR02302 family protein [Bartonella sp. F02]|uniref:TIGR02302 family protein n=1 Tax=Bartonella sp. F02 TaxID=2967262 RepID=UPI0022A9E6B3|nr:TIGR02302 family protein [Bartonella sp. F02]MCZ2327883.1 TIGR02302 family protein [Bartonella sp. F02]
MRNKDIKSFARIKLLYVRILALCVLCYERIWPRLLPFFLIFSLLCSVSWFGIFSILNYWVHLFLLCLFLLSMVGSLFLLYGFHCPTVKDIDRYIEQKSGLKNQPLSVQTDYLCSEDEEGLSAFIWHEHQRRMAKKIRHLRVGFAHPNSAFYDPMALRSLFVLLWVCAFSFSFGSSGGRLADVFDLHLAVNDTSTRVDAWITPPSYTGIAPIYLTKREETLLTVPEGSNLIVRVVNGKDVTVKAVSEENAQSVLLSQKSEKIASNDSITHFEAKLERSIYLSVLSRQKQHQWHLQVIKDTSPTIHWLEKPGRILSGSLELQYEMDDDYGVTKAFVEINPLFDQDKNALSLYKAPEINLLLARGGKGKTRMVQDVSSHPWAGSEVKITLVAEDGAGQQGRSKTFIMTLPQRIFGNPVARAVSEQRRLLALDASKRENVLDMLAALLVRPEEGLQNSTHFLALQSAWTRLSLAETEDQLRDVVHYLWKIALGIEEDQIESAQQRLKQAQAALRDALRHGASSTEIERLIADLRQAMNNYIDSLAQEMLENSDFNGKNLSEDTLQKKLNAIEEMAKTGFSSAAEQLLAEMEQVLDHLHVFRNSQMENKEDNPTAQMKEKIDQLGDLMRRQQEILNDTHQLEMENRRGANISKKKSDALKKRQAELQSELSVLEKELSLQGTEQSEALKEAEKKMNSAKTALGRGNHEMSIQNQSETLEALRQGAQNLLKKMREELKRAGNNQKTFSEPKDPLGRSLSTETSQDQENQFLPQESDRIRAQKILEEIRKRLGNEYIPEIEKNYLERLLRFN